MSKPLGRFTWYQVNATDVAAAKDFYTAIGGFATESTDMPDGSQYIMLLNANGPVGGIMALPEEAKQHGAPQHWLAYISSPDVDKTVMLAKDLGATEMVPPTDLPAGRFAVLGDPQGAAFAVFTPNDPPEDTAFKPIQSDISWHELMTTDWKAALKFYSSLFNWEKREALDMGDMGEYQLFGRNGDEIGGMMNLPPDVQAPPHWMLYIMVDDAKASIEQIKKLGGQLLNGPMEVPGGDLVAQCLDPQGGAFAIHSVAKS